MKRELKWKPDFAKTVERFEAWWHCQIIDRPPVSLGVNPTRQAKYPDKGDRTIRQQWLDVEYKINQQVARLSTLDYLGDSFPLLNPNLGPDLTATLYGCELEFAEHTSWSYPIVKSADEWSRILAMRPNFDNFYWKRMVELTTYAQSIADDRYLVCPTDLHGNYDILSALRGGEALCEDMIDCPETVYKASMHVAQGYNEAFGRLHRIVSASGFGSTCWTNTYHEGPYYVASCDFWCMVSPQMGKQLVLPSIVEEMKPVERSIFHLDGPTALPQLDWLLELPNMHAIQWVYGAGNEPAGRWLDVYKKVQAAGKGVQIFAVDMADARVIMENLKPEGVWLCIGKWFDSVDEAKAALTEVERWAARR